MNSAVKPDLQKPQGCTNLKLRQLMRRVARHYDDEVGKTGLKGTQYSLLSYVVKLGPIRAVDLAAEMKVSTSTLSRNLQPLVAAGLLAIGPGADARSRLISASGWRRNANGGWRKRASTRFWVSSAWWPCMRSLTRPWNFCPRQTLEKVRPNTP